MPYPEECTFTRFDEMAKKYARHTALIYLGQHYTYSTLNYYIEKFAMGLAAPSTIHSKVCASPPGPSETPAVTVTVLDTSVQFPVIPGLSGRSVAFIDYRNFLYGLYHVNIDTKQEQFKGETGFAEPQVRLSGDRVAWIGYPTTTRADVYVKNIQTNITTRVTDDEAFQNFPDIQGNRVVWQDYRNRPDTNSKNADIYMHDFTKGLTVQITTDTSYQSYPAIWGNRIVWQDYRNAIADTLNADIYMYDLQTNQETQITTNGAYQTFPDIWEDKIVWEDFRNGTGDIYMYDLSTHTERAISTYPAYKTHPVIYKDWIIWQDYRNGTTQADIYGYHLGLDQEYPILVQPDHQDYPQVDSNTVIWQDFRNARQDLYMAVLTFTPTIVVTGPNGGESWQPGSLHNITWKYADVDSVKIEYSTNGGSSWSTVVSAAPAISRSYSWIVPNTPTTQGLVRISDVSHPATSDTSNGMFTIQAAPSTVTVTAPNGGEVWLAGSAHSITWSPTSISLLRIEYSTDGGTSWINIGDNIPSAPENYPWTIPAVTTYQALVRLSDMSNAGVNDVSDALFALVNSRTLSVKSGWNMVSVPLTVQNGRKITLFPTATSSAYSYQGAYQVVDTLRNGTGYWLKFAGDQDIVITGAERALDSIPVTSGWNMIGSISDPVPVSAVTTNPGGIITSQFFGYSGSYTVADTIVPGRSYWIKVSADGEVILQRQ